MKALFPLKLGQSYGINFAENRNGQKQLFRMEYKVVAKDRLVIGSCLYDVLKGEQSNHYGEVEPLIYIDTEWYAPPSD